MKNKKPPLWKQLLGAVVGGSLALMLYGGYQYVTPKLGAYITIPELGIFSGSAEPVRTAARVVPQEKMDRISQRAIEISENYNRRIEKEEPMYDVQLRDAIEADPMVYEYEEGPVWEDKVQDDWWNTQQNWAVAEQGLDARRSTLLSAATVSADVPMVTASINVATTQYDAQYAAYVGSDSLPNSGLGTNLALAFSFFGAGAYIIKRKQRNLV